MEDLLATQNQLIGAINQLYVNFKKDGAERKTASYIKKRLDTLESYWSEVQSNHTKLCEFQDQSHVYFRENHFEKIYQLYTDISAALNNYISAGPRKEDKPILRPATPLSIPKFSNNPSDLMSPTADAPTGTSPGTSQSIEPPFLSLPITSASSKLVSSGNMSRLDEMLRKQKSNFRAFSRTVSNIDLDSLTAKWELEDLLKAVNSRWSAIDDLHWEIDSEMNEENVEYEQAYSKYEQKYNEIKKEVNNKMWSACHREQSVPKTDLPTFSGSYHQWTSFKDLFSEAIHNNRSLSNAQKLQFLKGKLRGEAEKIVQHLHITSDNYQVCWDILNHRYNNLKLIFGAHINIVLNLPSAQQQSSAHIKKIHDNTNESLNAIKNLGIDISTWDPLLVHLISQKLDPETHKEYIESLKNPRDLPTLKDFTDFLENKFTSLEVSKRKQEPPVQKSNQPENSSSFRKHQKSHHYLKSFNNQSNVQIADKKAQTGCPLCKIRHGIFHCDTFLGLQPTERRNMIAKYKLCINCLYDHHGTACISEKRCRECNEQHNTLIHDAFVKQSSTSTESRKSVNHVAQNNINETLLATALVKVQAADGSFINLRALIDGGSQISIISERAAQTLELPRQHCKGTIFGIGTNAHTSKGFLTLRCQSTYSDYAFSTDVLIMNNLINNLPNYSFPKPSWQLLEGIQLADPDFNICRPIDLLLGADVYARIIMSGIVRENDSTPIAQQTRLGWILCGNFASFQCNVVINNVDELKQFWTIEDIQSDSDLSQEDQKCIQHYKSTTIRNDEGRYIVKLPLHEDATEKLGDSKTKAVAQFLNLERKFQKNSKLESGYKAFILEYIESGHMRISDNNQSLSNYLPHHSVHRTDSTTTPLRVVFNASSKTSTGHSLNDVMYCGPNLQQDLLLLILKWRNYQFAFSADIKQMYRQILLDVEDQRYQKIIWRNTPKDMLQEYQLTTVTYGTKSAPFLAMMTLKQLAIDEGHKFSKSSAATVLQEQFFMDDVLSGGSNLTSAKQLQTDLIALLKLGGFDLRKWSSNKQELLEGMSTTHKTQEAYDFKHQESTKTLGLRWCPKNDNFEFRLNIDTSPSQKTSKRKLLSDISKIFDPLGWLSPVTTKLKILFQMVWVYNNLSWDDNLPETINDEWNKIKSDLENINCITVPRWLQTREGGHLELHGFCDASIKAYACVIYCKVRQQNQKHSLVIIAAKSRLVSSSNKNKTSLPRLELLAAELLPKLMDKVKTCLKDYNITYYCWSDSTAVLGWLQGDPSRWRSFVANRVSKITSIVPAKSWRYVKSGDNPADCASRGISAESLKQHPIWWSGPTWLSSFSDQGESEIFITEEELKKSKQTNVATTSTRDVDTRDDIIGELIATHSSWTRVTRVLAWILRVRNRNSRSIPYLTINELRKSKLMIIKYTQQHEFWKEINDLKNKQTISTKSKLLPLNPILDKDGLLRVGGRLKNANIHPNMIHPFILPHDSKTTKLLIDHAHILTFHGGAKLTQACLRQQFWIVGGNRAVKKRLLTCVKCRKHNPTKQYQLMAPLPEARVNVMRPFLKCGIDYTGYVEVKASKGRGIRSSKGYIAVFVCMATKAVHLELVSDLTSTAFLAALRRMSARRGTPRHIFSDNGTNFVGSNNTLQKEYLDLTTIIDEEFLSEISDMHIEWHFNAPTWASAGGLFEAAVKSLKYHMKRVIGEQKLTFEEFSTILAQLEACLNTRPLCAITEDPDDLDYLTPSHFLASGPVLNIIETETDERTRWCLTQKLFTDIWKRWKGEYLTQLSTRTKWLRKQNNMQLNDIVLIHDANLPAGKWAMGRVIELHPGADGLVRVVTLKTKSGVLKRPITKLSPLLRDRDNNPTQQKIEKASHVITSQPQVQRSTPKRNFSFYTVCIMLLSMLVSTASASFNITSLKNNQSMYFDKISNMYLVRDDWKLIVYYNMDPYWLSTDLFGKYINHLDTLCNTSSERNLCDVVLLQLRNSYVELQYYNDMLLNQRFSAAPTRSRRGLINGIGHLANSLFGILDENFAEQYSKDIKLIQENEKHVMSLWKNQTSVVEAEYNLLKRVESNMEKQYKIFNQHVNNLESTITALKTHMEFTMSAILANGLIAHLKNIQDCFLDTIADIYHGKFDIHLITPDQLREELSIVSGQLSKDLAFPINNIHTDLSKIYQLLKVKARVTKDYLIFEIKIPLVNREGYEIFRMLPIPQQNAKSKIEIVPISTHLAINIQKDTYLPMTSNDLLNCAHFDENSYLCGLTSPIYQMTSENDLCVKDQETKQCKYHKEECTSVWQQLTAMNTYLYFCCDQCTFRFICGYQVTTQQVSAAGIILLGNNCLIKSDSFTVYSHKQQFNEIHSQSDFIKLEIPPINNVLNFSIPQNVSQPDFGTDQMELEQIGGQIQELKKEQPLVDNISYHDVHHYVVIYLLLGAAVIMGAALAWRARRTRRRPRAASPTEPSADTVSSGQLANISVSVPCGSEKAEHSKVCVSDNNVPRVHNRATSPVLTKFDFSEIKDN